MGEHQQIVGVKKCIETLLPSNKSNKHFRFLRYRNGYEYVLSDKHTLKDYIKLVEEEIIRKNFTQQLDRQLKKPYNTRTSQQEDRITFKKDSAVTGSKHIAKQLAVSISTGNRRLIKWSKEKKIERVVVSTTANDVIRNTSRLINYAKQVPKAKKLTIGSAILNFSLMGSYFDGKQFIKRAALVAKNNVKTTNKAISESSSNIVNSFNYMWCNGKYC